MQDQQQDQRQYLDDDASALVEVQPADREGRVVLLFHQLDRIALPEDPHGGGGMFSYEFTK